MTEICKRYTVSSQDCPTRDIPDSHSGIINDRALLNTMTSPLKRPKLSSLSSKEAAGHWSHSTESTCNESDALNTLLTDGGDLSDGEGVCIDDGMSTESVPSTTSTAIEAPRPTNGVLKIHPEVRARIFSYCIPMSSRIAPTYAQGMLLYGLQGPVFHDENVAHSNNLDITLMLVNKLFRDEVSGILYSHNVYIFNDAAVCYWWLKRIGSENIVKLRSLIIEVYSGFLYFPRSVFVRSEEEVWANALLYLRHRHSLRTVRITIYNWRDLNFEDIRNPVRVPGDRVQEVNNARAKVMENISGLRGIQSIILRQSGCTYLSPLDLKNVVLLMQQPKLAAPPPRRKLSLAQLLAVIRFRRIRKEEERIRQAVASYRQPIYRAADT